MAETTRTRSAREAELLERAKRRLPGGVLGTSRYQEDAAFVVKHGKGSKIYDVSGREYIDYVLASGPLILGHAHPAVVAAVRAQIEGGSTYFMVNEPIIQLAEETGLILEAGRWAMSGANAQPWEYIVVTDRAVKKALFEHYRSDMDEYNFWMEQMRAPELRHPAFHVTGDPKEQLRKLKVYAGSDHPHQAQRPEPLA